MYKKALLLLLSISLTSNITFASFKEHYDLGQQYLSNYQYSGAITEFKNALRINYMDNSARIGLINSYMARATNYANNEHNYKKAADDYRSALFYMQYYPKINTSGQYMPQVISNLNSCLSQINFDKTPQNRYNTAKQLRAEGNFAAAAYEFNQTLADKNLQKDSFEQVGDIMKILGNNTKAAEYYRKAVAVAPSDLNLRLNYAKMLDTLGEEDTAVNEYNYILSKASKEDKDILYSLERIYKKKLEKSPENADITANLGAILQKQEKYDEALTYYQKAEYLNPSNINTRLNVGTLYQQKGDLKTAIKAYESILIPEPNNISANLYRAQALSALGNEQDAIEAYKKVMSLDPANEEAQTQLLVLLEKTMTTSQFIEYVKKNMPNVDIADTYYNFGLNLHKQNKLNDAISMYNESIKINPLNPEVYVNLGIAQNQSGDSEKALTTLKAASLKFPNNPQLKDAVVSVENDIINKHLEIAASHYNKENYKKAIDEYQKITSANLDATLGIANCYQAMGDKNNAITYYEKALKMKPTDSDIAYCISVLYAENNNLGEAQTYATKAVAINKNNTKAVEFLNSINEQIGINNLNKAIELYEANQYDESLQMLNKIIASDSSNSYAYYYRGMIYDTKERRMEAISDFTKAYDLNKEFEIVNYLIASDFDNLQRYKDAYNYYLKYSQSNAPDDEYKEYAKARAEELKEYAKQNSILDKK